MRNIFVFFICILFSLSANAQTSEQVVLHNNDVCVQSTFVDSYVDSLRWYRGMLDSLKSQNDSLRNVAFFRPDSRYARLFSPLNFYPDLAHRHFSLDREETLTTDDQREIDNTLLNFYLYHPQYVSSVATSRKNIKDNKEKKAETTPQFVAPDPISTPKAEEMKIDDIDLVVLKPNFWTFSGDNYLQVMQNYYSGNWYQGGESNYSILGRITLQANYNNKQKVKFENKLEMNLGFQTNKSDTIHPVKTSSDLLRYTGKLGLQASKKWYYTLQIVGTSQFYKSFATNSDVVKSAFLAPATMNASLGLDYTMKWFKGKLTGTVHLAPLAMNYKYVSLDELVVNHGIEEGKHSITDFGSTFTLDCNWKFSNNISWKTRLYGYTTYKRVDLQWENTINMKVSRFISANIYLYPRFDDSRAKDEDFGHYQLKEYTSLGLVYQF